MPGNMVSRVSVSGKVAGVIMVGCLMVGMLLGVVVQTGQAIVSEPQQENKLRGTVERRLNEVNEVVSPQDVHVVQDVHVLQDVRVVQDVHVVQDEELLPPAPRLDDPFAASPGDIVWPGEGKASRHGTGLWGSDEDEVWGDMEKLWARQEIQKVWDDGFMEKSDDYSMSWSTARTDSYFSYGAEPMANDFSYYFV